MKKFIVAVVIIVAFVLYSFVYAHANSVALVPTSTASSSKSSVSVSTTTVATPAAATTTTTTVASGALYKNGTYTGSVADAQWGNIQVQAIIQSGKISSVQFLQYPNERNRSVMINNYADPQLSSEAIQAQSANVDVVSGATDTSDAFIQSLTDALSQAKA